MRPGARRNENDVRPTTVHGCRRSRPYAAGMTCARRRSWPGLLLSSGRHTLGVDADARLVHRESGSRYAAGGLSVGKGGPSLAHRGPGLSHFGVGTPAGHILSEYLGGLSKGLLGPAATLGGEDDPVALQLTAL